jgi:hypothetical protein
MRSSLRAELVVELQVQDSIVAGRTPLELTYLLAGGAGSWMLLQIPAPIVIRLAIATALALAAAALAFVRIAGQDLTTWCVALTRYLVGSRLALYGSGDPR